MASAQRIENKRCVVRPTEPGEHLLHELRAAGAQQQQGLHLAHPLPPLQLPQAPTTSSKKQNLVFFVSSIKRLFKTSVIFPLTYLMLSASYQRYFCQMFFG